MRGIHIDPESDIVQEQYAVVYTPNQRRKRFPDNCVEIYSDEQAARQAANPDKQFHAAKVLGPSRSSEGFMLYYLVAWL